MNRMRVPGVILAVSFLAGCVNVGGLAGDLGESMARQSDPAVVRDGAPAYLIMADTLARDAPDDAATQLAAARLYSAYAGGFVDDTARKRVLTQKAWDYARRGLCLRMSAVCTALDGRFPAFRDALAEHVDERDEAQTLYRAASAWAGWIQARADDYAALADLPKVQAAFERVIAVAPGIDHGNAHTYLGVLLAQRPQALGGSPEEARTHFERAIELSDGRNLMAKVLYAKYYARLVFDRQLHDRLLHEVLDADPEAGDLTLSNELARQRARELLASADDYF